MQDNLNSFNRRLLGPDLEVKRLNQTRPWCFVLNFLLKLTKKGRASKQRKQQKQQNWRLRIKHLASFLKTLLLIKLMEREQEWTPLF